MRIAIDLDVTLNNLEDAWEKWIQKFEPTFSKARQVTWPIHEHTSIGMAAYDFLHINGVFRDLKLKMWSQSVVEQLHRKHEVYIVTAYLPNTCVDKADWLKGHFPFIPTNHIIFCNDKKMIAADVMIDDGEHNLQHFNGRRILFDAPWNQNAVAFDDRVYNWRDIEKLDL